jgi:hypothetical protein
MGTHMEFLRLAAVAGAMLAAPQPAPTAGTIAATMVGHEFRQDMPSIGDGDDVALREIPVTESRLEWEPI